jgi:hypothetical protein
MSVSASQALICLSKRSSAKASQAENPWSRKRGFVLLNTVPRRFADFPRQKKKIS